MFNSSTKSSISLDRRSFLGIAAGLVAAGVLPRSVLALAGPHIFKHGVFDVTVLSDGNLTLPLAIVSKDATPEQLATLLGAAAKDGKFMPEINVVALRSGTEVILIDSGAGGGMGDTAGKLLESLKAAAIDPASVTKVIFTHAHADHVLGAAGNGSPVFANATFHLAEAEYNFWSPADLVSKVPEQMQGFVKMTQSAFAAFGDRIKTFKPGAEVLAGIGVIDTPGHTPGHVAFELAGGDGLVIVGDAITAPTVFFAHPDWAFGFDADGALASKSRRALLDMASAGKKQMLGYHWPYPGLGRAEVKDGAFAYIAAS
jgi:glyoxylase-like metal-dependent hydrolase (beta-lactamase superfamily II)